MNSVDWDKRDKPYTYLKQALEIFEKFKTKVIVEIGTNRTPINHHIDDYSHGCCMEGHSSLILAPACEEFYSVDINSESTDLTRDLLKTLNLNNKWRVTNGDGIEFLKNFDKKIDLLFLDAWDVDHSDASEKHLEAYHAAYDKLNTKHIILIDDTDVGFNSSSGFFIDPNGMNGKGALLVPYLIDSNYKLIFTGRQTCLIKD
jgi:hypothetical protein